MDPVALLAEALDFPAVDPGDYEDFAVVGAGASFDVVIAEAVEFFEFV